MTDRTLTPGPLAVAAADIRDHGYAIVQTRIERIPTQLRSPNCYEPDGCHQTPTLATLALAQISDEGDAIGFAFARHDDGNIVHTVTCDEHRTLASHDLYYVLTGRTRPDGIRAFDLPGQHMQWT